MRFVAKLLLVTVSIPIFVLCVISVNARFQFLSLPFWTGSFEKNKVYSQVSNILSGSLNARVVAEGGKISDIAPLSDLVSEESVRQFAEENLKSILSYANGKAPEITVYMPVSVEGASKATNMDDIKSLSQKIPLEDFLREYDIQGISQSDIQLVSKLGTASWTLMFVSFFVFAAIVYLLFLLTPPSKRLIAPALSLFFSGITVLGVYLTGTGISLDTPLIVAILRPVLDNILSIWLYFAAAALFLGIGLCFLTKPANNKSK